MAYGQGSDCWIGIGEESTWGTSVSRTKFFQPVSVGMKAEITRGYSRTIYSLDPQRSFISRQRALGDIELEFLYSNHLKLLKHALGGSTIAQIGTTAAYKAEFARTNTAGAWTQLPAGLSVEVNEGIENYIHDGQKVNQLELRFQPDQLPSGVFSFVGRKATLNTSASSPTFGLDADMITPAQCSVFIGTTDWSAEVKGVTITVGNGLDAERGRMGSNLIKEPVRTQRPDTMVRLDLEYNDTTKALVADFLAGTAKSIMVKALGAAIGTNQQTFMVELPNCVIEDGFPTPSDTGIIPLTLSLKALAQAGGASWNNTVSSMGGAIRITVISTETSI